MAWDLWDPPCAPEESSSCRQTEWQCDFYFGFGFDMLEENALNEKYCAQVLRILIMKADAEIEELEQALVSMKCELAWIENDEWSEICCNVLTEKISCLDISLRSSKNNDKNDIEVHLLMHRQPVERLHEVLEALLRNYLDKKSEQPANSNVNDSMLHSLTSAASRLAVNGEAFEHGLAPKDKRMIQKSLSMSVNKPARIAVVNSIEDSSKLAVHSNKNKRLSYSDSAIASEEIEDNSSIFTADDVISGSSMMHVAKKIDTCEKVKPANTVVKDLGIHASRHATKHSSEKKLCKYGSKLTGNDEVSEQQATGKSETTRSSESIGNQSSDKPADAIVKNISAEAFRCVSGLSARKENSNFGLGTFQLARSHNPDIEQKLCVLRAARKRTMKESKMATTDNMFSLSSSLKTGGKKKNPLHWVKVGEAALTDTENCALSSLLELHDQKRENAFKSESMLEGKSTPEVKMVEIAAYKKRSNLNLSPILRKEKAETSVKSNPPILQETNVSTMVVIPSSSSIPKGQPPQKSGAVPITASVNQPLKWKIRKKVATPGACEAKEHIAAPGDHPSSVSQPQKKRKKNANFSEIKDSTLQADSTDLHRDTSGSASKNDLSVTESYLICDSSCEAVTPINLKDLKLGDLRAIAKQHNLTKYSKLKKNLLLELLEDRIGNC